MQLTEKENLLRRVLEDLDMLLQYYEERDRHMREYLTGIACAGDRVKQIESQALKTGGLGMGDKGVE